MQTEEDRGKHVHVLLHLSTAVPANSFIDLINYDTHMLEALVEEVEALGFDLLELLVALFGYFGAGFKG